MRSQAVHVAVCGGIAVGKTTLTENLSVRLPQCRSLIEHPELNPYLAAFYKDMQRWAFHSRIAMLAMFAAHYSALRCETHVSIVLMDRCIHELIVFAALQHATGNLTDMEYSLYASLHDGFLALVPPIDLVIYLHCCPGTALERARARGRPFEAGLTEEYLERVARQYDQWIQALPQETRVVKCDTAAPVDTDFLAQMILKLSM